MLQKEVSCQSVRSQENTPSLLRRRESIIRHSREGGNPPHHSSFPRRRESTIAAHAGIHRPTTPTPEKNTLSFLRRRESIPSVIPAKAGIHNCRARGNSSSHYPDAREKHSVIPAEARINTVRHSREGGNPQLPRTREFIVPLPQRPRKTLRHSHAGENPPHHSSFPRRRESTITAHAGIHRPTTRDAREKHSVIPAFAEMTLIFPEPVGTSTDGSGIAGTEIPGWPALCK